MAPNNALQLTWQSVTSLARARAAPLCHAAEPGRYAARTPWCYFLAAYSALTKTE